MCKTITASQPLQGGRVEAFKPPLSSDHLSPFSEWCFFLCENLYEMTRSPSSSFSLLSQLIWRTVVLWNLLNQYVLNAVLAFFLFLFWDYSFDVDVQLSEDRIRKQTLGIVSRTWIHFLFQSQHCLFTTFSNQFSNCLPGRARTNESTAIKHKL